MIALKVGERDVGLEASTVPAATKTPRIPALIFIVDRSLSWARGKSALGGSSGWRRRDGHALTPWRVLRGAPCGKRKG